MIRSLCIAVIIVGLILMVLRVLMVSRAITPSELHDRAGRTFTGGGVAFDLPAARRRRADDGGRCGRAV